MSDVDDTPEEFAADVEDTFWAAVSPADRRRLERLYREDGEEGLRKVVDEQIRDDLDDREAYVDAMVETLAGELNG